jgi:hypothetical protein
MNVGRAVVASCILQTMQPGTAVAQNSSFVSRRHRRLKYLLWALMGCATLLISIYIEIPLIRLPREEAFLRSLPLLILPHALAGTIALICGPLQFSSQLRRRYPKFHRLVGRFYVSSVFVAAPVAIVLATRHDDFNVIPFTITTAIQSVAWAGTTAVAFVAARNRRIQSHRVWMVRSYAVTFTFVFLRLLRFIPAWNHLGAKKTNAAMVFVTLLAVMIPEIASFGRSLGASFFHRTATD